MLTSRMICMKTKMDPGKMTLQKCPFCLAGKIPIALNNNQFLTSLIILTIAKFCGFTGIITEGGCREDLSKLLQGGKPDFYFLFKCHGVKNYGSICNCLFNHL